MTLRKLVNTIQTLFRIKKMQRLFYKQVQVSIQVKCGMVTLFLLITLHIFLERERESGGDVMAICAML